jgi:4-nitrophenyl phosphatase
MLNCVVTYKCVVFDLDGTLYLGSEAIPHAKETVQALYRNTQILFFTNNASATPQTVTAKLTNLGFPARPEQVLTSGAAAAKYAWESGHSRVFVVGESGLVTACEEQGLKVINRGVKDVMPTFGVYADALIAGICRGPLSYDLLDAGLQVLKQGAQFIASNTDATFPHEQGVSPGGGAIVAALTVASGVVPYVAGKPNARFLLTELTERRLLPKDCLVVGDRIDTDIDCALAAGCTPILVRTGVDQVPPTGVKAIANLSELLRGTF